LPEFSKSLNILVQPIFDSGEGVKCALSLRGPRPIFLFRCHLIDLASLMTKVDLFAFRAGNDEKKR